jgi:hypothetical protein
MNPLQVVAFVPMALGARLRQIERRLIRRLHDAGAQTTERAIVLEAGGALARFVYQRLEGAGALQPAGHDRYYLDEAAYGRFRGRRRKRALLVLGLALLAVLMVFLRGDFR